MPASSFVDPRETFRSEHVRSLLDRMPVTPAGSVLRLNRRGSLRNAEQHNPRPAADRDRKGEAAATRTGRRSAAGRPAPRPRKAVERGFAKCAAARSHGSGNLPAVCDQVDETVRRSEASNGSSMSIIRSLTSSVAARSRTFTSPRLSGAARRLVRRCTPTYPTLELRPSRVRVVWSAFPLRAEDLRSLGGAVSRPTRLRRADGDETARVRHPESLPLKGQPSGVLTPVR